MRLKEDGRGSTKLQSWIEASGLWRTVVTLRATNIRHVHHCYLEALDSHRPAIAIVAIGATVTLRCSLNKPRRDLPKSNFNL